MLPWLSGGCIGVTFASVKTFGFVPVALTASSETLDSSTSALRMVIWGTFSSKSIFFIAKVSGRIDFSDDVTGDSVFLAGLSGVKDFTDSVIRE